MYVFRPINKMAAVIIADDLTTAAVGDGQDMPDLTDDQSSITVSIETILLSAVVFIGILSWFEFLRAWYDNVFAVDGNNNPGIIWNRFWYAVFITSVVIILVYIIYRISARY
jgi:hypothetical protein